MGTTGGATNGDVVDVAGTEIAIEESNDWVEEHSIGHLRPLVIAGHHNVWAVELGSTHTNQIVPT